MDKTVALNFDLYFQRLPEGLSVLGITCYKFWGAQQHIDICTTLLRVCFSVVNIVSKAVCFHCLLLRIAVPADWCPRVFVLSANYTNIAQMNMVTSQGSLSMHFNSFCGRNFHLIFYKLIYASVLTSLLIDFRKVSRHYPHVNHRLQ